MVSADTVHLVWQRILTLAVLSVAKVSLRCWKMPSLCGEYLVNLVISLVSRASFITLHYFKLGVSSSQIQGIAIVVCAHCPGFKVTNLLSYSTFSTHGTCTIVALAVLTKDKFIRTRTSLIVVVKVLTSIQGTWYSPTNSLWTARSSETWHITIVTRSLLELSLVLSAMTVMKGESWHSEVISRSILRPITLITSHLGCQGLCRHSLSSSSIGQGQDLPLLKIAIRFITISSQCYPLPA